MDQPTRIARAQAPLPFAEFVLLIAAMMALTALGIDAMLPALPAMGDALDVIDANDRQYVITAFLLGFSIAQLVYGPLSDRFGRKRVLGFALAFYAVANVMVAIADSFTMLLIARFASGTGVAGARVISVAIVRDRFAGRAMARVMSLAFIFFMAAPILAPSFGQVILLVASWRWIFAGIAIVGTLVFAWFWLRMPETLDPKDRLPLDLTRLKRGYRIFLTDRTAMGYTLAALLLQGGLFGFINSVQQIVFEVFDAGDLLVIVFACVAGTMAVGSFLNSRIVMRFGTRLISHLALFGFVLFAAIHLLVAMSGQENLVVFILLQALMMACFGLAVANFSSMSLEDMGAIAGTASSLQGFLSTMGGALIGAAIGQAYNGTTVPLYTGFLITGVAALAAVLFAERGKLFQPSS